MTTTINADNGAVSGSAGLKSSADATGVLALQTNGTTAVTVDASQNVTLAGTLTTTGVTTFQAGTAALPAITTTGDTNTGIFFPAADTIAFSEGGVEAARIDSGGNFGLGVTPSAWSSASRPALQLTNGAALFSRTGSAFLSQNFFYNAGDTGTYIANGFATVYVQTSGQHQWYNAPSGTAGNTAALTQAMTLDASGNLGVGTTSPGQRLSLDSSSTNATAINFTNTTGGGNFNLGTTGSSSAWGSANGFVLRDSSAGVSRFFIDSSGNTTFSGNIGIGGTAPTTSGTGITFPATQNASANANTLDDYEEGTWTPSVGGTATYTEQLGSYTKIGNFVKIRFHLHVNVLGTGSTTTITGIPFNPSSTQPTIMGGVVTYINTLATAALAIGVYAQSGSIFFMTRNSSSTGATTQAPAVIGNSFDVYAEISYMV